jgi:hypothetical protein
MPKLPKRCEPTVILKAEPLDPSFKWRGHQPERRPWRSISLLLAIAVGAGFLVGRLSTAGPAPTEQRTLEQQAATADSAAQSQGASQSDVAAATRSSSISTDTKPAAKEETKANAAASSTEPPKTQSATATDKRTSSPSVALINPSTADKGVAGEATKKVAPKSETEPTPKATVKTASRKAGDDASPAATVTKRQAKSPSPAHSSANAAPVRQESVVTRRDDAYVAPRRDEAYVPPRVPQAAYPDQRDRYDSVERGDDRARLEQPYPDRRFAEPDRRYAEDAPPPRTYNELRREYLRPFRDSRDVREDRRFGGYDDDPYVDRRPPMLRPMYGGRDD